LFASIRKEIFNFFWWQKKQNHFLCNQRNRKLILALTLLLRFAEIASRGDARAKGMPAVVHLAKHQWKLLVIYTLQKENPIALGIFTAAGLTIIESDLW